LGVSIQVVGSSFDLEGSSDEAGGRASEDLECWLRRRASFTGRRRKSLRGCPTLFSGRGKLGRGSRTSRRRRGTKVSTSREERFTSGGARPRSGEVRSTSGELDPRSGEARTRASDGRSGSARDLASSASRWTSSRPSPRKERSRRTRARTSTLEVPALARIVVALPQHVRVRRRGTERRDLASCALGG
jgi:hypothetical protein